MDMTDNKINAAPSIMFIAGDPSGEQHASHIVRELKRRDPKTRVYGIGGQAMAAAGLEQIMPFEPFNRMGYLEVIKSLKFFLDAKRTLIKMMSSERRPDILVCVDYSGFNIPMMKAARKLGIHVIWYIAPMVWAWKRGRARTLGKNATHIATIFPFENKYFEPYGAPVTFAGNPVAEAFSNICGASDACPAARLSNEPPLSNETSLSNTPYIQMSRRPVRIAIIPGSRPQEIKYMLDPMVKAAAMFKEKYPLAKIVVSRFHQFDDVLFQQAADSGFELSSAPLHELLRGCDLALVTSGTATLETALSGVPMVIVYRTSRLSYSIYKRFVKIKHVGLPNIIAEKRIVPEYVQDDVTPQKLFDALKAFMTDPQLWRDTVDALLSLRARLGERKPSVKVADIICSYVE